MQTSDRVFVAGGTGMLGSAIVRALEARGHTAIIVRRRSELDLTDGAAVNVFFAAERPDVVFLAAGRVGGIQANIDHPAEFLYDNLALQTHVIHQAYLYGVKTLCFTGTSCAYPRACRQPMVEDDLLTGPLEPTNEAYAVAKIAGIRMVAAYRRQYGLPWFSVMPCNLYGTNDTYDPAESHVVPALIKKFVDAGEEPSASVTLWGTGIAQREFMHVDDAAAATVMLTARGGVPDLVNIGCGDTISIRQLAGLIAERAGFRGSIAWDSSRPDGMPAKRLDTSRLTALGFTPGIALSDGLDRAIAEYRALTRTPTSTAIETE